MGKSLSSLESGTEKIVSIGFVLGIGLIMLGKFQKVSGITSTANAAVGEIVGGLADIGDWIGIIVLVIIGAYLLYAFRNKK